MKLADLPTAIETAAKAWVALATDMVLEQVKAEWPDVGPKHPYATGKSLAAWRSELAPDGYSGRVWCGEDYAGYTELGYTRSGPETAGPYMRLGTIPYAGQHALSEAFLVKLRDEFERLLNEAIHGN